MNWEHRGNAYLQLTACKLNNLIIMDAMRVLTEVFKHADCELMVSVTFGVVTVMSERYVDVHCQTDSG